MWWWREIKLFNCFISIKQIVLRRLWARNQKGKKLESVTGKPGKAVVSYQINC